MKYGLYGIVGKYLEGKKSLLDIVEESIKGGVDIIQLREKNISTKEYIELALKVKEVTKKYGIPLIINDRVDVALACDADGVHVGNDDMPVHIARRILGKNKIVGASASTVEEALMKEREGADYIGAGSVFPTISKGDAGEPIGLDTLKKIKKAVSIPVVAIGGINEENIGDVIRTGVDGIAVISAIYLKEDIYDAAKRLKGFIELRR